MYGVSYPDIYTCVRNKVYKIDDIKQLNLNITFWKF